MPYIGNTVQTQGFTPAIDYFNGNGVTVTFTLSRPIASVAQVIVAIDNVIQNPSSSFTVAGNAITFSSAPLSGTNNIWVEYTSLITTFQGISQDPTVIGDIRATGGYLAEGDFGNSFVSGAILDYVTGLGRVTVGPAEGIVLYNGGTASRSRLLSLTANGALGVGTSPSYGTSGQYLQSTGSGSAPSWTTPSGGVTSVTAGTGISLSASTGAVTITNSSPNQLTTTTGSPAYYGCRAWVNFNGNTLGVRASANVSSITRIGGAGQYTIGFTTNMPDTGYAVSCVVTDDSTANRGLNLYQSNSTMTVSSFQITIFPNQNPSAVCAMVIR